MRDQGFPNHKICQPMASVSKSPPIRVVKPENAEASVTEGRAGVNFYPWRNVGFGAQYAYTKFRYERGILDTDLSGSYLYQGLQVIASFAF